MGNVQEHLKLWSKEEASDVGRRVATLLDEWQGLHHFDQRQMQKVDWSNPSYIALKLSRFMSPRLSTFDFDDLTTLVFLCHDHCIRAEIVPLNQQHVEIVFHARRGREGQMSLRHPPIETAIARWRERHKDLFALQTTPAA